jgi:light-regulated signal transduction histidine kinase (bacteriophytochrome)
VKYGETIEGKELILRRPGGELMPVLCNAGPIRDKAGHITGAVVAWRDITDRKRAEETLRETVTELERSNKDLEQFAYVATHDLQEPLRQVTSFVNLLRDRYRGAFDAKGEQYMTYVVEGANRMSALVSGLLDYSRVGRREETVQSVPANEAYAEAVANLRTTMEEAQAQVTCDRLATMQADRVQLVQLFQNLIGNAIKFRREGVRPEVHVGCRPDGQTCTFWVRDNGIGIASEHHGRASVIFQRLHGLGKYPGTGIGLAICKKIVERHGGRIWIESQVGQGSTFFFTMPAAKEAKA